MWISLILALSSLAPEPAVQAAPTPPPIDGRRSPAHQPPPVQGAATQAATSQPFAGPSAVVPAALTVQELDDLFGLITGSNTPEARRLGAKKLLEAGTPEAAERLAKVLRASPGDLASHMAVCQAVANHGATMPELIEPLIGMLGAREPELVEAAINALRQFDGGMVIQRLQPIAADSSVSLERRLATIQALGAFSDDLRAAAALVSLTQDQNGQARATALSVLSQAVGIEFADPAAASAWLEQHASMNSADWAAEVDQRRTVRMHKLRNEKNVLTARLIAASRELYLRLPEDERPRRLLAMLSDELPEVRELGLDLVNAAITDRKDISQEIKSRLVEMITDPHPSLRLKVALIVGDLRLGGAVSKLIEALGNEVDHRVRAALVHALGRLDGSQAIPALIERLNDEVPSVVAQTAMALAAIARPTSQEQPEILQTIAKALMDRFAAAPPQDEELREKFLDAMTRIGAESFRAVFKAEMSADRSVRIRRAAVAGLAGFGDLAAADDVLPLLASPESEIRLAAVAALGKCGRRESDLAALMSRLDGKTEAGPVVRQRAWESYVLIAERLPPQDHLRMAEQFARSGDKAAQRQRLELLTALRSSAQRFDQLKSKRTDRRTEVLEAMADAHGELGEFSAAAACLTQAVGLIQDPSNPRYAALAAKSVSVLLAGHEDESAVERLKELTGGEQGKGEQVNRGPLAEAVLKEADARIDVVTDAATYADATRLLGLLSAGTGRLTPEFGRRLGELREAAHAKRDAVLDAMLNSMAADPQAETKMLGFSVDVVLRRVQAKLADAPATSAPASIAEEKLVQIAKRLAPQWPGYSPGCPAEERAAALKSLKTMTSSLPSSPQRIPGGAGTTSAPASQKADD